eukprot:gene11072-14865_t
MILWVSDADQSFNLHFDKKELSKEQLKVVEAAQSGDPRALNNIGVALLDGKSVFGEKNPSLAFEFFNESASYGFLSGMVNLARCYLEGFGVQKSSRTALQWYQLAAERGHQKAAYNVGTLFAQGTSQAEAEAIMKNSNIEEYKNNPNIIKPDLISALEYFHKAYLIGTGVITPGEGIQADITRSSSVAHGVICDTLSTLPMYGSKELIKIWDHSNIQNVLTTDNNDNKIQVMTRDLFEHGLHGINEFNSSFVHSNGKMSDSIRSILKVIVYNLGILVESYSTYLSPLQLFIVLDNLQEMIGPVAAVSDEYATKAGIFAEALALSHYCRGRFAVIESDPACFNGAVSSAVSYYRRVHDLNSAMRVFKLANDHPDASTHWRLIAQTPRVYHSKLRAAPWWNYKDFHIAMELQQAFINSYNLIQSQLDDMIALKQGSLRSSGSVSTNNTSDNPGLQTIFTPFIGVKEDVTTDGNNNGAGGWAEFGPLFDGKTWSEDKCNSIPILCNIVKQHKKGEVCGSKIVKSNNPHNEDLLVYDTERIEDRCGSDTLVTLLRLKPGTHILPHCGTTNRRLIMHFPLRGAKGVDFRVGDDFGNELFDVNQANDGDYVNNYYHPTGHSGWIHSYHYNNDNNNNGDGSHPIIFDDSFEHEVIHKGEADRYIMLIVLNHPDADSL